MKDKKLGNLTIEGARILFRNFSGREEKYNPAGRRNFCVILEDQDAAQLIDDGWNIRYLKPREEEDIPVPYLQVSVAYENFPPKIILISGKGKVVLDEESVNILDWAEIDNIDIIIRPYKWDVNGKTGVKAYVKSMYVTLVEDEFEAKYYDIPDSPTAGE